MSMILDKSKRSTLDALAPSRSERKALTKKWRTLNDEQKEQFERFANSLDSSTYRHLKEKLRENKIHLSIDFGLLLWGAGLILHSAVKYNPDDYLGSGTENPLPALGIRFLFSCLVIIFVYRDNTGCLKANDALRSFNQKVAEDLKDKLPEVADALGITIDEAPTHQPT